MADESSEADEDCCTTQRALSSSASLMQTLERFNCSICLELVYKPIVQACGHILCFWCVFKAMSYDTESHCPVCRGSYMHFPRVCEVLHFMLAKAAPEEYKKRAREVQSIEEKHQVFSPCFLESPKQLWSPQNKDDVTAHSTQAIACPQDDTCGVSLFQSKVLPPASHNDVAESAPLAESKSVECVQAATSSKENKLTVDDFCCALCAGLLYRPVVLNCGEVFCESCLEMASSMVVYCPSCRAPQPKGPISICFELHQFLEYKFHAQYSERKKAIKIQAPCENIQSAVRNSSDVTDSKIKRQLHVGIGCDGCGMSPIVGDRFRCEECIEKIGFDLCGNCYKIGGSVLGRFNQQHQPNHRMVQTMPRYTSSATIPTHHQYEQTTDHDTGEDHDTDEDNDADEVID